jgi:hypothetical protein
MTDWLNPSPKAEAPFDPRRIHGSDSRLVCSCRL